MQEKVAKLLEEARAAHHAKLHEHQEAEQALAQFQQHVSNLALQVIQLDARVKAFQEVNDAFAEGDKPKDNLSEHPAGDQSGEATSPSISDSLPQSGQGQEEGLTHEQR